MPSRQPHPQGSSARERPSRLSRSERDTVVLDTAAELFYARGVHEVGMDELVRETGLGKATVYRLHPTKDELIGAYLRRHRDSILELIDADMRRHDDDPGGAVLAILQAISADLGRPTFRGCAFNNASIEFPDPAHPAREAARSYRAELLARLVRLAERVRPGGGAQLGGQIAVVIDGMYTSAAHLGPDGPASTGPALVRALLGRDG